MFSKVGRFLNGYSQIFKSHGKDNIIYIFFSVPSHLTASIWNNILLFHKQGDYETLIQYKWIGRTEWVCLKSPQAYCFSHLMTKSRYKIIDLTRVPGKVKAKIKSDFFIGELTSLKNTRKSSKVILVTLCIIACGLYKSVLLRSFQYFVELINVF